MVRREERTSRKRPLCGSAPHRPDERTLNAELSTKGNPMHTTTHRSARPFVLAALLATPLVFGASPITARPQTPLLTAEKEWAVKLPSKPQEHDAMSEEYKKKAAAYREEATFHRKMLADYKARVAVIPKSSVENPFIRKMRIHCEGYIKDAEALAADADRFADYHHLRAEELRGK